MYPIPANATRIRYLGFPGTAYVMPGVSNTSSQYHVEMSIRTDTSTLSTSSKIMMGNWRSSNADSTLIVSESSSQIYCVTFRPSGYSTPRLSNTPINGQFGLVDINGAVFTCGGSSTTMTVNTTVYAERDWCIGGSDAASLGISTGGHSFDLAYWKYSEGGVLIRDMIPVRVGQVGYLFDRVSGQFFGNAGTGDFVLGPDTFAQGVVPTRMCVMGVRKKSITFIRATGTCYPTAEKTNNCSYINTAINPDAQTIVEIVCRVKPGSAIQAWPYLLGAQTANDNANTFSVRGQGNNTSYAPWTNYRWGHSAWQSFGISETWGGSSTWHTINVSRSGIVLDGIQYTATGTTNTNLPNKPIFIGCINRNGSPQNCILLDVASLKIWNGTTLQFDGTPQVVNGVAGLKDSVSGSLFSSSSSSNPYQLLQEPAS